MVFLVEGFSLCGAAFGSNIRMKQTKRGENETEPKIRKLPMFVETQFIRSKQRKSVGIAVGSKVFVVTSITGVYRGKGGWSASIFAGIFENCGNLVHTTKMSAELYAAKSK